MGDYAVLRGEHGDMMATLDRERQRSQEDLKELSSQLVDKCTVIEQLESELKEVRSVVSESETTHLSLTSELKTLEEEKASLVEKLGKKAAVVKEIAALKAALSLSEETVGNLTAEREELMERIDGLERKVSSLTLSLNQKQDAHNDEASFDVVKEDLMRSLSAVSPSCMKPSPIAMHTAMR